MIVVLQLFMCMSTSQVSHIYSSIYFYQITFTIKVPLYCDNDYSKPPGLIIPPPSLIEVVQGESITITAEYKGDLYDHNLQAFWCITTLDGKHDCISPVNSSTYNVMTNCLSIDCCYFNISITLKSLTLSLSQAKLSSVAVWEQDTHSFNPGNSTLGI